jgi:Ni/Co efflux regulator RcnB
MQSRTLVCALAAASLAFSSLSFAQATDSRTRADPYAQGLERGDNDRRGDQRRNYRGDNRADNRADNRNPGRGDNRNDGRDNHRDERRADGRGDRFYYNARGPEWRRGGYVPQQYRSHQYVVNDWRGHYLNAPPRGHQWVQVGGDYVLMAIATGLIVNLLLSQ